MDRARRTAATARRKTFGDSASPHSTPPDSAAAAVDASTAASPAVTPQTASHNRRGSKGLHTAVNLSTPVPGHRSQGVKRRSRTMDGFGHQDDEFDDDSPKKGGHTLRKRARVDYTFEHVDEEVVVPNSTSARAKKRRSDNSYDSEDLYGPVAKRRGASPGVDNTASARRNSARKPVAGSPDHGDDEDVKDTIEVGVSFSDMDESEVRLDSRSSASSPEQSLDGSSKQAPPPSDPDTSHDGVQNGNSLPQENGDESNGRDEYIDPQLQPSPTQQMKYAPTEGWLKETEFQQDDTHVPATPVTSQSVRDAAVGASPTRSDASHHNATEVEAAAASPKTQIAKADDTANESTQGGDIMNHRPSADVGGKNQEVSTSAIRERHEDEKPLAENDTADSSDPADNKEERNESQNGADSHDGPDASRKILGETAPAGPSIPVRKAPDVERRGSLEGEDAFSAGEPKRSLASSMVEPSEKVGGASDPTPAENKAAVKSRKPSHSGPSKPQPSPQGRWSHLTPYVDGEYVSYPERKTRADDDAGVDDATAEEKEIDKEANDSDPLAEDNDDAPDTTAHEAQTPALDTPLRGSPAPDFMDPAATNSPAPAVDDPDDGDMSDSQDPPQRRRCFKYRKLRDPEEYLSAIENYGDMTTAELYGVLQAINVSLVQWQTEWTDMGKVVDDYENSLRRRAADTKYESRTRNLAQHGVNHEEPDFVVKGYKAKERELMSETRYLQGQDRIMAATYGFEYDPHPSKIGRQNPETQQDGIMTRGRTLRNQPRQTVKASEADEVTGKRQRKPVQLFDPAAQDVSRSSTPVPLGRGRRRRNVNADDDGQATFTSSFNGDGNSDADSTAPKPRRRRGPRASQAAAAAAAEELTTPPGSSVIDQEETGRSGRRRAKQPVRYDDTYPDFADEDSQPEPKQAKRMLTLKMPRGKNFSEQSSAITDNGDSRPSTASSASSSHTIESSYSFRPKRQKRFRDDPDESEEAALQAPPRKRGKRNSGTESSFLLDEHMVEAPQSGSARKVPKIKVVRQSGESMRNGTPSSATGGDGDDKPKDYKSMTKSEKMSASMKSRWANGNMAGAVEKRKATLAAKKAAQAAADPKVGAIAPKPKVKTTKKDAPPQGQSPVGSASAVAEAGYPFSAEE